MARTLPVQLHLTFNDIAVSFSEEEWSSLQCKQLELYLEVMNENYANLQELGLPVPDANILQHAQQWKKRPVFKAGEPSHTPLRIEPALEPNGSHAQQYETRPINNAPLQTGVHSQKSDLLQKMEMTDTAPLTMSSDSLIACKVENGHSEQMSLPAETADKDSNEWDAQHSTDPPQELQLHNLASFSKKMLFESKPKCLTCGGKLNCYCNNLKRNEKKPYTCMDCGKGYGSEVYLFFHQKTHLHNGFYKCSMCEKSFVKHRFLRKHLHTHHTGVHVCKQCQMVFPSLNHLRTHRKNHQEAKKHPCVICGATFSAYTKLSSHLKEHKKPYECPTCQGIFLKRADFVSHLREHNGEKIYRCKLCLKVYTRRPFLTKHMSVHLAEGSADVKEDTTCMQEGSHRPSLSAETSLGVHKEQGKNIFSELSPNTQVPPMASPSSTLVTLKTEENLRVGDEYPSECNLFEAGKLIQCKQCKKHFRHHTSFLRHIETHQVRFVCCWCGRKFCKLIKLYLHRIVHQIQKPFTCKHCKQTFSFQSLLLLHQDMHSLAGKLWSRYPCAYCRKIFRSPIDRDVHHKSHIYQPVSSPAAASPPAINNITIAPFTDHNIVYERPVQGSPVCKDYIKRLCYRSCDLTNTV